jgi:hypothetical protein
MPWDFFWPGSREANGVGGLSRHCALSWVLSTVLTLSKMRCYMGSPDIFVYTVGLGIDIIIRKKNSCG